MKDEFDERWKAAKGERNANKHDLREIYKFLFNGREFEWDEGSRPRNYEPEEIFDSTAAELNMDLAGDLVTYLTPDVVDWVSFEAGSAIPEDYVSAVTDELTKREKAIGKAIRSSNYYHEAQTIFQEAGIGTVAAFVDRDALSNPIYVEPVPVSELSFVRGYRGLEDRFRSRMERYADLPQIFPGAAFPEAIRMKIDKGTGFASVCWGWWRDYSDPAAPVWIEQAKVDGKLVSDRILGPEGACPLLIGRFGADPNRPYGRGPAWRRLPEIRVIDELSRMLMQGIDNRVDPAYLYSHDGLLDLQEGLESGKAYATYSEDVRRALMAVSPGGDIDYGYFSHENLVMILASAFYQDGPRQEGKTPPTATQWLDEAQKIHRRVGKPAGKLWSEFVAPMIRRVEFLEVEAGNLDAQIMVNERIVTMRPISPLEKAQGREDSMTARSILDTAAQTLGEQTALVVDGAATIRNLKNAMGDKIVEVRSEEQMMALMQAMSGQNAETPQ
jgi:hypothetical protein